MNNEEAAADVAYCADSCARRATHERLVAFSQSGDIVVELVCRVHARQEQKREAYFIRRWRHKQRAKRA